MNLPPPPGSFNATFTSDEKVIIDLSRASGLSVGDFLYTDSASSSNESYVSTAHVQGSGGSGWAQLPSQNRVSLAF